MTTDIDYFNLHEHLETFIPIGVISHKEFIRNCLFVNLVVCRGLVRHIQHIHSFLSTSGLSALAYSIAYIRFTGPQLCILAISHWRANLHVCLEQFTQKAYFQQAQAYIYSIPHTTLCFNTSFNIIFFTFTSHFPL